MTKKKTIKKKIIKKTVKRRAKKKSLSRLFPPFILSTLLLLSLFGVFLQKPPTLQLPPSAPVLPKKISLHITPSPTPITTPIKRTSFIAKAEAAEDETSDFCINLPILFYHHVEPIVDAEALGHPQFTVDSEIFEQQMHYLKEQGYITVSMDVVVDDIINKKTPSPKTVALTFDDGYADMYAYAFPILKNYSFVGNFAIPTGLLEKQDYLTWEQLTEIARDPSMKIYNHTSSHADLNNNPAQADAEITTAQNDIQTRLGLRSNIFFYPYGSFNDTVISTLRSKGYIAAVSTLPGTLQCESTLMYLHRTRIGNAPLSFYGL